MVVLVEVLAAELVVLMVEVVFELKERKDLKLVGEVRVFKMFK